MSHEQRHRKFDPEVIFLPVESSTVVEAGDLVAYDASNHVAYPASSESWDTDLATTQANFADNFVGVCTVASADGQILVGVATDGLFELACAAATFDPGDPVGPADSGSSSLKDQEVVSAVAASSVGVVVQRYGSNTTTVVIRVASKLRPANANISLG